MRYLILASFLSVVFSLNAQCLDELNKRGYFDSKIIQSSAWWTSSVGKFSIEEVDSYYGTGSLRVEVPENNNNEVKMFTANACNFSVTKNQSWNISLYAKGEVGDNLIFSLVDADNKNKDIGSASQTISYKGWHFIRINITSNEASTNAKFKLGFKNKGTYFLDNIILNQGKFNNWYVDDNGLDTNDGSKIKPFKTIKKAISQNAWKPGDIINVMSGEYHNDGFGKGERNPALLDLNSSMNGTVNLPIVIRAFPGEIPKIIFDGKGGFVAGNDKKSCKVLIHNQFG